MARTVRPSTITDGRSNLSRSSACHWARSVAGASTSTPALALGHELRHHDARLDGLPEPDLVGQHAAAAGERLEREGRRLHLVRIEVDPGFGEGAEASRSVARPALRSDSSSARSRW